MPKCIHTVGTPSNPALFENRKHCRPYPYKIRRTIQGPRTKLVRFETGQAFMFFRKWPITTRAYFRVLDQNKSIPSPLAAQHPPSMRLVLPSKISYQVRPHNLYRLPIPVQVQFQPTDWTCLSKNNSTFASSEPQS